jgi:small subunit ribosomal protein S20
MPKSESSLSQKKRARQNVKNRAKNRATKSLLKTQVRKVVAASAGTDKAATDAEFKTAVQKLDRAAAKGVIHKNAAARKKSRLSAMLKKAKAAAK